MSEALCRCGHAEDAHNPKITKPIFCQGSPTCTCVVYSPPPTREPIRLTDEERFQLGLVHWDNCTLGACLCGLDRRVATVESIVAARLAGGPTLADAWDEGYTNGYRLAESYLTRPDGTHVLPTNPYRTPESEDD